MGKRQNPVFIKLQKVLGIASRPDDLAIRPDPVEFKGRFLQQLATLKDAREREVVKLIWGLESDQATLKEIGIKFNVCPDRVRQIESRAFRQLAHPVRSRHIPEIFN